MFLRTRVGSIPKKVGPIVQLLSHWVHWVIELQISKYSVIEVLLFFSQRLNRR